MQLHENAKFCPRCGAAVSISEPPVSEPVRIPVPEAAPDGNSYVGTLARHSKLVGVMIDIISVFWFLLELQFAEMMDMNFKLISAVSFLIVSACYAVRVVMSRPYMGQNAYCRKCMGFTPHNGGVCGVCYSNYSKKLSTKKTMMAFVPASYLLSMLLVLISERTDAGQIVPVFIGSGVYALYLALSHGTRVILEIAKYAALFCPVLFWIMDVPFVDENDQDSTKTVILVICLLLVIILSVALLVSNAASTGEERYCHHCKRITRHNYFGVCTECYTDPSAMLGSGVIAAVLSLASMGIWYDTFGDRFMWWRVSLIMLIAVLYKIYMYPAIMARRTEQAAAVAIYWLNLLLGWTGILWLVLLIWGSTGRGFGSSKVDIKIDASALQNAGIPIGNAYIPPQPQPEKSMIDSFEELKKLHEMGMLTDDEFEQKRREFVSRL